MQSKRGGNRGTRRDSPAVPVMVGAAPGRPARLRTSTAGDNREARALAFLGDVLIGESTWSVDEVTKLLALHTLVAVGHRRVIGADDAGAI